MPSPHQDSGVAQAAGISAFGSLTTPYSGSTPCVPAHTKRHRPVASTRGGNQAGQEGLAREGHARSARLPRRCAEACACHEAPRGRGAAVASPQPHKPTTSRFARCDVPVDHHAGASRASLSRGTGCPTWSLRVIFRGVAPGCDRIRPPGTSDTQAGGGTCPPQL